MSAEIENQLELVEDLLARIRDASRFEDRLVERQELEKKMGAEGFWDDSEAANAVIAELKTVKSIVDSITELESALADARALFELGVEADDADTLRDAEQEARRLLASAESLELRTLLNGKYDAANCYLLIQAGAGGTESCDWAQMLKRMYLRWAERNGFKYTILEESPGDEAGIKSVTIHVVGAYAYGYLSAENGVHRLVRISPFDAQSRRHTSFGSVRATPEVGDIEVEIDESDLRVDRYRASGAGGQHVNTTDSAVRITHIPTGIVVQCQNERSQHSNRAAAMRVLAARLYQHEESKRNKELASLGGEKGDIAFGSQIRNYVLAPYKLVKDARTGYETGNAEHVLDGDLTQFIESYLRFAAKQRSESS